MFSSHRLKIIFIFFFALFTQSIFSQVVLPSVINCPKPEYPNTSRRLEIEGITTLQFLISEEGVVISSQVTNSSGSSELDMASIKALSKCTFNPKLNNGKPEKSSSTIRFSFRLEGSDSKIQPQKTIYTPLEKNTLNLKEMKISSFSFGEVSSVIEEQPTCRGTKKYLINPSINKFIEYAFNEELRAAKKYEFGNSKINVKISSLDYSTFLNGYWSISVELSFHGETKLTASKRTEFTAPLLGGGACNNATQNFPIIVQELFSEIIAKEEFKKIFELGNVNDLQ